MSNFEFNGSNLGLTVIEELKNLRRLNRRRLQEQIVDGLAESPRCQAIRRQLYIIGELIRVGRQPLNFGGLMYLFKLGLLNGELYAIGD